MSTHTDEPRSAAPSHPDAVSVGPHLVIDVTEWVPGPAPETHRRYDGQRSHWESYFRCLACGAERQARAYFPDDCSGVKPGDP